jgi:hypothetical protein
MIDSNSAKSIKIDCKQDRALYIDNGPSALYYGNVWAKETESRCDT